MPGHFHAQARYRKRQLMGTPWGFAKPERNARRLPFGIFHAQGASFQLQYPPTGIAELENVTGHAFDGKILVHRANKLPGRLQDHPIIGIVGNRPTTGDGGQPCAFSGHQGSIDAVTMQIGPTLPTPGTEPLRQHFHHLVKLAPLQIAVRPSPAHGSEQLVLAPILAGDHGHDLLGQYIQGLGRNA